MPTDFRFSYSSKRDIVVCPHRYELSNVLKIPQPVELRRFIMADAMDQALTDWIIAGWTDDFIELAKSRFDRICVSSGNKIRWKSPTDKRDCYLQVQDAAAKLVKAMQGANLCRSDAVPQPSVKHVLDLSGGKQVKLTGRLDVLYKDVMWIYDLKMTENPIWLDRKQLIYYDFVVSVSTGKKVQQCGFLAPLINPPVQTFNVGKEDWEDLLEELNFAVGTVNSGVYPDMGDEKKDCYMCLMKKYCRRYSRRGPVVREEGNRFRVVL